MMYRNIVLTVIAACLLWICARDVVPWSSAHAALFPGQEKREPVPVVIQSDSRQPPPVKLENGGKPLDVSIQSSRGGALRNAGPIDVRDQRR
jgi:hypothetical protein